MDGRLTLADSVILEDEIEAFIPTPYYKIEVSLDKYKLSLDSYLDSKDRITSLKVAESIKDNLNPYFTVINVEKIIGFKN